MNIIIRVDVHPKIGIGHIMRCLKLVSYYDNTVNNITFICKRYKNMPDGVLNEIYKKITQKYRIKYIDIDTDILIDTKDMTTWLGESYIDDYKKTIRFLSKNSYLIVDHYGIDKDWELIVKNHVNKLIVIDDFIKRSHYCDAIINCTTTDKTKYINLINSNCKLLLGMEYALIGKEFFSQDMNEKEKYRISIFISGTDITDETSKIIRQCKIINKNNFNKYTFDVIVGGLNSNYSHIKKFCEENEQFNLFYNIDNMAEVLNRSYISIGALGQSLFERIALKIPSVVIAIADNQKNLINTLIKSDTFIFLGSLPINYYELLEKNIINLYNADIYKAKQINCEKFIKNIKIDNIFKDY